MANSPRSIDIQYEDRAPEQILTRRGKIALGLGVAAFAVLGNQYGADVLQKGVDSGITIMDVVPGVDIPDQPEDKTPDNK